MKADPKTIAAVAPTAVKAQPFKQLLSEARNELNLKKVKAGFGNVTSLAAAPRPLVAAARPQLSVVAQKQATIASTAHAATATTQQRSRAQADGEAVRLGAVRGDHAKHAESLSSVRAERTEAQVDRATERLIDFITKELSQDPMPASTPVASGGVATVGDKGGQEQVASVDAPAESKAEQAVALIEKIETFVKSARPGLSLTLNNSLGAQVEIERIGPREIALKLVGQRGPPSAEAVSRIREELLARGLKVGALSVS